MTAIEEIASLQKQVASLQAEIATLKAGAVKQAAQAKAEPNVNGPFASKVEANAAYERLPSAGLDGARVRAEFRRLNARILGL